MTTGTAVLNLKRTLLDEYKEFADKRIKKIEKGSRFIVDGRDYRDMASDGAPFGWFCPMFLDVIDGDTVRVRLTNVPTGPTVARWAERHGIRIEREALDLSITGAVVAQLTDLATALRAIVAPGAPRYSVPSYKYAVPRTADSLDRLAATLERAWER